MSTTKRKSRIESSASESGKTFRGRRVITEADRKTMTPKFPDESEWAKALLEKKKQK